MRATAAVGAVAGMGPWLAGCDRRPRMNLYIWSNYLAPETVPDFERETGIRVTVDTYESNEELAAKLLAGAQGYDVIVPSSYILPSLVHDGLLLEIPPGALANLGNIAPTFRRPESNPYPGHAVPYMWGLTGIAWRRDKVAGPPDSWGIFLDPAHAGRMTMMDDAREVFGAMLRYRGHSINSTEPALLAQARDDAIAARPNLLAFVSAPVKGQVIAGDVWIAHMWSGEASNTAKEAPEVDFLVPREGSAIWTDLLAIPANAPNVDAAIRFIDYILRPEVGARIAEATGYGCPNAAATALLANPVPYPTEAELARLEFAHDLGPATELVDRYWTEVKAG
ncbi:MAG TPA: spermidine/putrescine ABC transporter substrate-binding protein [Gemmatimonadales bacterium]|nr:spermidine/putrescine ABC transporter substrate-binding protein [Gemmatimonadales bacterium]